jgi:hypothetical protein
VVFGGVDSYDTTWLWDGHRWSLARPQAHPPGRFHAAAAYNPQTRLVMLYGGRLGPGPIVDDTWAWDGRTWRELDTGTASPPAGEGAVMAWDSASNEMVLVGNEGGSGGQTWIWDGVRWLRQPNGDLAAGIAFVGRLPVFPQAEVTDSSDTRVVILGTFVQPTQGAPQQVHIWSWAGSTWTQLG